MSPSGVRLGCALAVLAFVCLAAPAAATEPAVNKLTCLRIEAGMPLPGVQTLLGTPGEQKLIEVTPLGTRAVVEWKRAGKAIEVEFLNGRVVGKAERGLK